MLSKRAHKLKKQLTRLKPLTGAADIQECRRAQNSLGGLMTIAGKARAFLSLWNIPFKNFSGRCIVPAKKNSSSVILYLHGGGYTAGGIEYATGFGSLLVTNTGLRVLCAAYRLAPEHPAPAALEDALLAYKYLFSLGYAPEDIILMGESAGGGLCWCLAHRLKDLGIPLPRAIAVISPWTDLTFSGESFEANAGLDPSLNGATLRNYARLYAPESASDKYVSPLFGDFSDMPPSLIIAGGDEILLSDSTRLADKLREAGGNVKLCVTEGLWHVFPLYPMPESEAAMEEIKAFIGEYSK